MRNTGFKGTRIPVDLVADMLGQGATAEEILEGYPTLSEEMISLAPLRRGNPDDPPYLILIARAEGKSRLERSSMIFKRSGHWHLDVTIHGVIARH